MIGGLGMENLQEVFEMHDKMIDLTVDLELEYNKVLSVLLIDYDNFREWEDVLPFYKNMKKDGIMLWSAG